MSIETEPVSIENVITYVVETYGADEKDIKDTVERLLSTDEWKAIYDFADQFKFNTDVIGHDVAIHMGLVDPQWSVLEP